MTSVIVFLASYLVWLILVGAVVLVGLDLWQDTNPRHRSLRRLREANWRKVGFILLASLLAFLLAQLLHLWPVEYYRPYQIIMTRPLVMPSLDTPFPSDHVMLAFGLALAVVFMTKFKKIGLLVLLLAAGVAVGRVLALVHTPLDVFGGIICALAGAAVWYYLYYRDTPRRLPRDLRKLWKLTKKVAADIGQDAAALIRKVRR
ncbi:MAG: phosphatase PAP2 family protein [Candidatus Nomurabacteria bacterium]|jgi:membrane-associated phospholipid phosphatase|nr:phosphatase PAP2 family protein [Candidatus Nomurabacteria bacterium]